MRRKKITFTLNGKKQEFDVPVEWTLLRLLREGFHLTGTKCSCAEGECGACTVILDKEAVTSCIVMAVDVDGREVTTIEGLEQDGHLHPLQEAFIAVGAIQCGYCTPGMIMSAKALLDKNPHPTDEEIRVGMSGNLCRCTGYDKILEAIRMVADQIKWQVDDGMYTPIEQ